MVWFLLLLMATTCAASSPTNLNAEDCVIVFPRQNDHDYVQLYPSINTFTALTLCLRAKTELCRDHVLFSAAVQGESDAIVVFWDQEHEEIEVYINGHKIEYKGLKYDRNKWHSICITWDSATGLVQLFIDGHETIKEFVGRDELSHLSIILGQRQTNFGGGFDEHDAYVGELADLNMWDYVLKGCEIKNYIEYKNFCPGNAVRWRDLSAYLNGKAVKAKKQICTQDDPEDVYPEISYDNDYQFYSNNFRPSSGDYVDYYSGYGTSKRSNIRGYSHRKRYYGVGGDTKPSGYYTATYYNKGRYYRGSGYSKYGYGKYGYYSKKYGSYYG